MTRIRVSPDELDQVSQAFKNSSQELQQTMNQLNSRVNNLFSQWEGIAKNKFNKEYELSFKYIDSVTLILNNLSQELKEQSEAFRQADQTPIR